MNITYHKKKYKDVRTFVIYNLLLNTEIKKYATYLISMAYDNTNDKPQTSLFFLNDKISKLGKIRLGIISMIFANKKRCKILSFIMWCLLKQDESKQLDFIMLHAKNS